MSEKRYEQEQKTGRAVRTQIRTVLVRVGERNPWLGISWVQFCAKWENALVATTIAVPPIERAESSRSGSWE